MVAGDGRQLGRELEDGFFNRRGLFWVRALAGGELRAGFVLQLGSVSVIITSGIGIEVGR